MEGECVAYILGKKEFFGLEFLVNPSVLVPRPETELLVEVVIRELGDQGSGIWDQGENEGQGLKVLDLCTGSGAVAIALKHEIPILEVWAADISNEALEVAKNNATRLLPPDAITFCQGNLYDALLSLTTHGTSLLAHCSQLLVHNSFSFIVSNPPYVSTAQISGLSPEVRAEPILALDGGSDGLDLIRIIISQAPKFLCPGGMLLLEADPGQMKTITTLFQQAGFTEIQIHKGLSGSEQVIGARKAK
ncbi:MAG: peptide chain release factor N(5)-glutamine methyltransferase, partial [Treponema sp.]|jgi:release factor glutamine methyltransferase|nr:peptide chain release factor N(5)-glutamine methyltransferase [Treponema sp.]